MAIIGRCATLQTETMQSLIGIASRCIVVQIPEFVFALVLTSLGIVGKCVYIIKSSAKSSGQFLFLSAKQREDKKYASYISLKTHICLGQTKENVVIQLVKVKRRKIVLPFCVATSETTYRDHPVAEDTVVGERSSEMNSHVFVDSLKFTDAHFSVRTHFVIHCIKLKFCSTGMPPLLSAMVILLPSTLCRKAATSASDP